MMMLKSAFYCVLILEKVIYAFSLSTGSFSSEKYPVATTQRTQTDTSTKSRYERGLEDYDEAMINARQSRGMMDDHYDHHDHDDHHDHTEAPMKMMEQQKAVADDPWASYYDFIINEGSFKFWAVFQLLTALLLIYSAVAAAYYAKFNVITTDYEYYDDFFARSNNDAPSSSIWSGLSSSTFQRIFDAISSKKYT